MLTAHKPTALLCVREGSEPLAKSESLRSPFLKADLTLVSGRLSTALIPAQTYPRTWSFYCRDSRA